MMDLGPWRKSFEEIIPVPGDKSLTHRAILFSVLATGEMEIGGWLDAADTRASLTFAQALGVKVVEETNSRLVLQSHGIPQEPHDVVGCGNSGTTMRIGAGLAAAVPGMVVLTGDDSLRRRPMKRVAEPLGMLGVPVLTRAGGLPPLAIQGGPHGGGRVTLAVSSAQVKSALLLAGLTAEEAVTVAEPLPSRDHSERLLQAMGARLHGKAPLVTIDPGKLAGIALTIPGDPSSAAFWCALSAILPGRRIIIPSLLFNPTRVGFFRALERMGAQLDWHDEGSLPEAWGSLTVAGASLGPIRLKASDIPAMVDEVPLLALLATQALGTSVIEGAQELRVKECDRISVTTQILRAMGAEVEERSDGWVVNGPVKLRGAQVDAQGDHRMAMLAAVAATVAEGSTYLQGEDSVAVSYPRFFRQYEALARIAR